MKKHLFNLMLMLLISPVFGLSFDTMPESLQIREIPNCMGCAEIKSGTQLIGSLLRLGAKEGKRGLIFEFLDESNQKRATLKFRKSYIDSMLFDLFDGSNQLVGRYYYFTGDGASPGFRLYAPDNVTIMMEGIKNPLYTRLTISSAKRSDVMMKLSCPFFSWVRDWNTTMINTSLLSASHIDPNGFAAILAFQALGQLEPIFETSKPSLPSMNEGTISRDPTIQLLIEKVNHVSQAHSLFANEDMLSTEALYNAEKALHERYIQIYDDTHLNEKDKITQFVNCGIDLIESNTISIDQQKAMVQFIMNRLTNKLPLETKSIA